MNYIKLFESFTNTHLSEMDSYKSKEYHQCIMDYGYNAWQQSDDVNNLDDMYKYIKEKLGDDFALMMLIGSYNYQVGNGGHIQYIDNGYAETNGSEYGSITEIIYLLKKSILYKRHKIECDQFLKILIELESILKTYDKECSDCNGTGTEENPCDDCHQSGEEEVDCCDDEECEDCNGNGTFNEPCDYCEGQGIIEDSCSYCNDGINVLEVAHLDDPYYKINDNFMDICEKYSKALIDSKLKADKVYKSL